MQWRWTSTQEIIVVSERPQAAPVAAFVRQLEEMRYAVSVLRRISYDETRGLQTPQAVLVDAAYPGAADGHLPPGLRATWEYVPIILFTPSAEVGRIGFSPDLHSFVTLPIAHSELEARIRFAVEERHDPAPPHEILVYPGLRMDLTTYEVWLDGTPVALTFKEFALLKCFLVSPRRVFSRADLLRIVWDSEDYGETRTVDVHIRRLRAKLGLTFGNLVHTVRNVGYRFG